MENGRRTHVTGYGDAPVWLRVVLPAAVYPLVLVSAFWARPVYDAVQKKEGGIEWLSVAVLLVGVAHGVMLLWRYRSAFGQRWLVWWFGVSCAGMFVLAGEEVSWGQHFGLWGGEDLPETLRRLNDQQETNLHNMTNALDQGPTNVVVGATFFAFVVLPVMQRMKRETMGLDNPGYWFWPSPGLWPAALGVLLIPFPGRVYEWVTGAEAPQTLRHSEIHECYIALLMAGYAASVHHRARAVVATRSGGGEDGSRGGV